ncbi:hypothetical protein EVAR_33333_1 [Eumeta japonica]|uniref:Uncharacterized protein n=1 Tax=Eumeta variegata TaxID=151549 RepID=A0A4C1YNU5_EUMVA|nr:hypothetical protein EVAR_33333_1 [Eumeta japonica]
MIDGRQRLAGRCLSTFNIGCTVVYSSFIFPTTNPRPSIKFYFDIEDLKPPTPAQCKSGAADNRRDHQFDCPIGALGVLSEARSERLKLKTHRHIRQRWPGSNAEPFGPETLFLTAGPSHGTLTARRPGEAVGVPAGLWRVKIRMSDQGGRRAVKVQKVRGRTSSEVDPRLRGEYADRSP